MYKPANTQPGWTNIPDPCKFNILNDVLKNLRETVLFLMKGFLDVFGHHCDLCISIYVRTSVHI